MRIAVFEQASFIQNDIVTYRAQYGLPNALIADHSVDNAQTRGDMPGSAEADLDFEMLDALAFNASKDNYVGPNSPTGTLDIYSRIVTDNKDQVISTSWGQCESQAGNGLITSLHQLFMQAASQGQSIFAASGDFGSDDCNNGPNSSPSVDYPASDPYVFGVGGVTEWRHPIYNFLYQTAWNHDGYATGGGLSSFFAMPAWQNAAGVQNHYSTGEREVPDVAGIADPDHGAAVYCTSSFDCKDPTYGIYGWWEFGGTSVAAPTNAAMLADMNRYLIVNGHSTLGWANQEVYTAFTEATVSSPGIDFTIGNNDTHYYGTPNQGSYPTTVCYDMATGLGQIYPQGVADTIAAGPPTHQGYYCPVTTQPSQNVLQDPSFEFFPNTYWNEFSARGYELLVPYGSHDGGYAFYACGYPGCDDRISQTFQVPTTVTGAAIYFWMNAYSGLTTLDIAEPPAPPTIPCLDHISAQITTPDGTPVYSLMNVCASNTFGYRWFDLSGFASAIAPYAGKQLVLTFRGSTSNVTMVPGAYSGFLLDDVQLYMS
jgi:kumamolisin